MEHLANIPIDHPRTESPPMRLGTTLAALSLLVVVAPVTSGLAQDRPQGAPLPVLSRQAFETGPPADRPADDPGVAPADGLFYVPGEFVPDAQGQPAWRKGYWSQLQTGWTWVPARWVRLSRGWAFIDGSWQEDASNQPPPAPPASIASPATRVISSRLVIPATTYAQADVLTMNPGLVVGAGWGLPTPMLWATGFGGVGANTVFGPGPLMGSMSYAPGWGWGWGGRWGWGGNPWGWGGGWGFGGPWAGGWRMGGMGMMGMGGWGWGGGFW
jgi:hypothetical protein